MSKSCKCGRFTISGEVWNIAVDGELHAPNGCGPLVALESNVGRKDDQGKDRWNLVPWAAVTQVVKVLTFGANHYGDDNWRRVEGWRKRYFAAACRHLTRWVLGERTDPATGLHHLAHAACCVLFLLELDV